MKGVTMILKDCIPASMYPLLIAVIAVETVIIGLLVLLFQKRFKKFKKAEQNFTNYLAVLDKTNERLKSDLVNLRTKYKVKLQR